MLRRRRHPGSRSRRYKRRLLPILGFSTVLGAGLALLVGLAYAYGNGVADDENFFSSVHATLTKPAVAALVALAAALLIAWGVRHLIFELLAWWPGRILVEELVAAHDVEDADVARLTAELRDRLARSHLQSPAPVPAAAPQGDFLDVLTSGGMDPTNIFSTLLGLLRAAKPTHAYEVKGALCHREGPEPCGVTVHVVRLPGKAGPGLTVWASDWGSAVAAAADHATASILPRTRRCRAPWSGWRGYHLPSSLVRNYERACALEHERRYDEALDAYYKALREDPMNLGLRLQIGFLQEKLAIFMDALATYDGILAVARPGKDHYTTHSRARPQVAGLKDPVPELALARRGHSDRLRAFYRSRARRERERVLLVCQYRRAILLGGTELAAEWCRASAKQQTHRDAQREALRKRLGPPVQSLFEDALESREVEWFTRPVYNRTTQTKGALWRPSRVRLYHSVRRPGEVSRRGDTAPSTLVAKPPRGRCGQFEELCVLAAVHEIARLRAQVPRRRLFRGDVVLTRAVIDLSGLCLRRRLGQVLGHLAKQPWPEEDVDSLTTAVQAIEGGRGFRRWQEHYNAACVYALPLMSPGAAKRPDVEALASSAIERLERAVACADSGFIASRRDWLLSDDPDLDGLRTREEFKTFEAMFFPSAYRTCARPAGLHKWELARYTVDVLAATAERFEQAWDRRRACIGPDTGISELGAWCDIERTAWESVRDVASHHQHWRTRMKLIEVTDTLAAREGLAPLAVGYPRFSEDDVAPTESRVEDVEKWVKENTRQLAALGEAIDRIDQDDAAKCALIDQLALRRVELGEVDAAGVKFRRAHLVQVSELHSLLWLTLRKCVRGEVRVAQLDDAVRKTLRLWRSVIEQYPRQAPARPRRRRSHRRQEAPVR